MGISGKHQEFSIITYKIKIQRTMAQNNTWDFPVRRDNSLSGELGFMEGLNNKIRVIQCRAYGIKDKEYLRFKVLTSFLPDARNDPH